MPAPEDFTILGPRYFLGSNQSKLKKKKSFSNSLHKEAIDGNEITETACFESYNGFKVEQLCA